jgi:hypothetical protein
MAERLNIERVRIGSKRDQELEGKTKDMCAWRDCTANFDLKRGGLPPGWSWLLVYWAKRPQPHILKIPQDDCFRDTALCPQHTFELEQKLKDLGRALNEAPPAGRA